MKKTVLLLTAVVILFTLFGCAKKRDADTSKATSSSSTSSKPESSSGSSSSSSEDSSDFNSYETSSGETSETSSEVSSETSSESNIMVTGDPAIDKILAKYSKKYLSLDSYDMNRYLLSYWKGDLVFNEQVLMVCDKNGVAEAPLMYQPLKVLSVRDATMDIEYTEGQDWVLENGKIKVVEGGSIIPMKNEYFYPSSYNVQSSWHRYVGGKLTDGFIRIGSGAFFQPKYLNITYIHTDSWNGPVPEYKGNLLPKTMAKLKSGQKTKIVIYGDSISHGDDATGNPLINVAPYMPVWAAMSQTRLQKQYGSNALIANLSVGGWTSFNGINGGYECYLQKDVTGAKKRVGSLQPDLVVLGFGQNDGDLTPEQLKANVQKIMDDILSVSPNTEFMLLGVMCPNAEVSAGDVPSYPFYKNQYLFDDMYKTMEKTGVAFLPIKKYQDVLLKNKRMQDILANNINHPNDFFYRLYAQLFCQALIENF